MSHKFRRPKNKEELEDLEARGFWKAQSEARQIAEDTHQKISLDAILRIHKIFFQDAYPEIAGRFRVSEDVKKLNHIEPPPGRMVKEMMYTFWIDFDQRLSKIKKYPPAHKRQKEKWLGEVLTLAAWTQHQITIIHPFCDGNGRMARILTNVVLLRFGLQPSNIHYEGVDKRTYLNALQAIDDCQNYDSLKTLIGKSMMDTYRKIYAIQKKLPAKGG